ncbi:unnamed protein product [Coregonus sp. 'balchen']|nr:unnamed protein product [Coregonus sp. 'balchen']
MTGSWVTSQGWPRTSGSRGVEMTNRMMFSWCREPTCNFISSVRCCVAVVRVSGPASSMVLRNMAGLTQALPPPCTALLWRIIDPHSKELLDRGLVLWFPGPYSFTGEEFHIHRGPAVITVFLQALGKRHV